MNAILSIQTTLYFIACNGEDTYYSGFSSKATPHTFLKDYGSWHSRALLLVVWSCVSCWSWYDDHTSWLLLRLLSCFSVCLSHTDSVRPHRRQPTRLRRPWDSPGKNTRVGCHFLLQCMKVKSGSEVAQSCPTRSDPMDCKPLGSSVHWIFQARVLAWGAIAFSIYPAECHSNLGASILPYVLLSLPVPWRVVGFFSLSSFFTSC